MLYEAHGISRFVIVCGYTDLRKGIEGLSQVIEGNYKMNPFERDTLFLFCGKRGDRIKALLWEGNGYLLLYKRCPDNPYQCLRNMNHNLQYESYQHTHSLLGLSPTSQ